MNASRLMTREAIITRRSVPADPDVDEYGNPQLEESTIRVSCELQQASRSEQTVDADWQIGDWNLYLAATDLDGNETEIEGSDVVTIDGVDYEVIGPPWPARNPRTGALSHVEARVRRVAA